jgi:DNA-binding NarL/FixJ family response regulator
MPIRVLLADDHDILRQGVKLLLGLQQELHLVGEARTGQQAIELVAQLKPDVIVMDISMPDMDGLEACRMIRRDIPSTQVLMLTMHESEVYFLQALRAGAAGYLVKKAAPTELYTAIHAVACGGAFLSPDLAKILIRIYQNQTAPPSDTVVLSSSQEAGSKALAPDLHILTPRELEVLVLVAEGKTNQAIATQLGISVKTVQAHRANLMKKLGLQDITQVVRFAVSQGIISP